MTVGKCFSCWARQNDCNSIRLEKVDLLYLYVVDIYQQLQPMIVAGQMEHNRTRIAALIAKNTMVLGLLRWQRCQLDDILDADQRLILASVQFRLQSGHLFGHVLKAGRHRFARGDCQAYCNGQKFILSYFFIYIFHLVCYLYIHRK